MLKRVAALMVVCAGIATWMACTTGTSSHFVYATIPAANTVLAYREDPNSGVLTPLVGSPFTTGTSTAPQALLIHPSKKFLYVANSQENDISLFTIGGDGALTEVTPRTVTGGTTPMLLAVDTAGSFLYVANAVSNSISVFAIDAGSGALSVVSGSPYPIGISPISMKVVPSGNFLYVGGGPGSAGLIEVFSVSAGALSAIGAFSTDGTSPYGLAIDPTGAYLYAANKDSNSIAEFTIDSTGGLTPISGSPVGETFTAPLALLIDPSGKFLYVANQGSNNIAGYSIASGGALTVLTDSPYSVGNQPSSLAADPNGKYLFAGNQTSAAIQVYSLDASAGTLGSLATYSTGNTATSIAVLQ